MADLSVRSTWQNELADEGFDSEAELDKAIKLIEGAMKRSKKDAGESEDEARIHTALLQ